ncbi:MAG TPA: sterol desaturase family protein [Kofleriaceae bacterium]|nr:sterol desaturase family protein [Kofleriaceae bacterium]
MFGLANLLAIAGFIALIAIELAWGRARGRITYAFGDAVMNAVLGLGSVVFGLATVLQGFVVHRWLDAHAPFTLDTSRVDAWIVITIVVDLAFYVGHRAMHRVNLFWAIHATHHQSEHMNLLVALRIGWFSVYFSWIFYLPLALLGVTLETTLLARGLSSLYQFWLHTELIGKLGPLEYVLVTPSHHRVHHARNAGYVDRNYGGLLIVWDRLFGTFAEEREAPSYGTSPAFRSHNPLWANVVEFVRIVRTSLRARRLRDPLQIWLRPPEWEPPLRDPSSTTR